MRRLRRHRNGKLLGGVAIGLGRHLEIDPVLVRIGFVVLSFLPFPGFGLLVYLVLLIVMPLEDGPVDDAAQAAGVPSRGAGFYIGIGLVTLAGAWVLGMGAIFGGDGFRGGRGLIPLLLIGIGIALWVDADRRSGGREPGGLPRTRPGSATDPVWYPAAGSGPGSAGYGVAGDPFTGATAAAPYGGTWDPTGTGAVDPVPWDTGTAGSAASGWSDPSTGSGPASAAPGDPGAYGGPAGGEAYGGHGGHGGQGPYAGYGGYGPPGVPPGAPSGEGRPRRDEPVYWKPPRAEKVRSPLGRATVGIALLAGGAVWLLSLLDVVTVTGATILATVLLVLGLGLLVGAVAGRARWVSLLALPLAFVTLFAAIVDDLDLPLRGGISQRYLAVDDGQALADRYDLAAGSLTLDLSSRTGTGQGTRVVAVVGAGELYLRLPDGAGASGRVRVEVGELSVRNQSWAGFDLERTIDVPAEPGMPTYELDLRVGAGQLRIERWSSTAESSSGDVIAPAVLLPARATSEVGR